jgi:hypothetical protein
MLIGRMVVRVGVEAEVSVRGFVVNLMTQSAIRFTVNVNIKEGKMAVPLRLHGELNALMDTIQAVKELRQLAWTMGPDDERVIHVVEPAERLVGRPFQSRFLKALPIGSRTSSDPDPIPHWSVKCFCIG